METFYQRARMNDPRRETDRKTEAAEQEIDRQLMDDRGEGEQEIVDAAADASERDREGSDSPERIERSFGVDDPSHSKGSVRRKS